MSELPDPRLHAYRPDLADASLKGRVEAKRFVAGKPAQVARGIVDLRRRPAADAPLDSQLLFGESVTIFDEAEGWAWVQNRADGYVGYVEAAALGGTTAPATHVVAVLRTFLYPEPNLKTPPRDALSLASPLSIAGERGKFSEVRAGGQGGWVYSAHLAEAAAPAPDYVATALSFLGVPYLWGGRSSLGLDCSALVQLSLARAGIPCPRDSDMAQDVIGTAVEVATAGPGARRGDVVYFPGHCAIALDESTVVHANAGAMLTAIEPLGQLVRRVEADSGGRGITAVRRL